MNQTNKYNVQFLLSFLLCISMNITHAQSNNTESDNPVLDKIITPDLERREITEDQLDSEDWEIGIYTGIFSIEDFGSNAVNGIRLAYHMTEDFVIEANYGVTEGKESSGETLNPNINLINNRDYTYYNISLVYNIFQGEVFLGRNTAFNSAFYILAGGGNTTFNDTEFFTYTIGGGLRFYLTDSVALHATVKDHILNTDVTGEEKTVNNIEGTLGLSFYF